MSFVSTVRQPPRRRSARRIAATSLVALSLFAFTPGQAEAYPCGSAEGGRVASSDCPAPAKPKPKRKQAGEPNLVSLTIFVVALAAVLVIPINYARRSPGQ